MNGRSQEYPEFDALPEPAMPPGIARLPVNKVGYPIPYFVDRDADVNGEPDFRIADSRKLTDAIRFARCWVCGQPRGRFGSFVIGPMCAINRTSAEPPCHHECAVYSAMHCPFLTRPGMVRRDRHLPENRVDPAGVMLLRNPGVALVWTSRTFVTHRVGGGTLFDIGDPTQAEWFAEGRVATTAEIRYSIDSGLPALQEVAAEEGAAALAELQSRYDTVVSRWAN
jgi:hypothetical protein